MFVNQFKRVYQFKVVLKGTKPPIWRRIQVPGNYSFENLHVAIQNVWIGRFTLVFLKYFDPDNVFFTAGSGNPPLPKDINDALTSFQMIL